MGFNIISISYVLVPLIITNIIHMFIVKFGLFEFINKPLHVASFGINKTWRGIIFVSFANMVVLLLYNLIFKEFDFFIALMFGFICGLAYVLFELPNSFIKRKSGIRAGERPEKNSALYMLMDKSDSALGVSIVAGLMMFYRPIEILWLFLLSVSAHILISYILVVLKIKKAF